ncbi:hypothetical protein [Streptomyces sp. NPDC005438]|uniref:hypothetical protein n=1 Tax=Streptomyces sp. NPDC005438 TaxID=3156880 RepID=UPI0033A1CA05
MPHTTGQPVPPTATGPTLPVPPAPFTPPPTAAPGTAPATWRRPGPVVAVLLALALLGGALTLWWADRNDDPLDGRPRVDDHRAGVTYPVPEGWRRQRADQLIDAFSSGVTAPGKGSATVLASRGDAVADGERRSVAEHVAGQNAVFFFPDGSSDLTRSEATTVDGHPAHTVLRSVRDEGRRYQLRATLISLDAHRSALLLGVVDTGHQTDRRLVEGVFREARVR